MGVGVSMKNDSRRRYIMAGDKAMPCLYNFVILCRDFLLVVCWVETLQCNVFTNSFRVR